MLQELSNNIKPVIKIFYGPYEANGIIKHRQAKLKGLIDCLKEQDYVVELITIANLNLLNIEILTTTVYTGSIKFLKFNTACTDDPLCQKIVCAVREALGRIYNPVNPEGLMTRSKVSVSSVRYPVKTNTEVNYFRTLSS